jgi:DNA repair protein RadC
MKETMKDLPVSERPYERCERLGAAALSDAELLAVILRTGCVSMNSLQLAHLVLNKDENHKNLSGLMYLSREQLMEIPGVGRVKALQLQAIAELARRLSNAHKEEQILLGKPIVIAEYFMNELRYESQECVHAVYLDQKCRLIKRVMISKGTVNASMISAREIYIEALKCNAVNLVLVHNHPSGNPKPSAEDAKVTAQMKEVGRLLHIPLIDHIIIGDLSYYSFAEAGRL